MNEAIFGHGDILVRVDMARAAIEVSPFPSEWQLLGGRALTARILCETVDPECDPLGPDNKLVIAPGLLTGTAAATSGRLSFGAKSPLTRGIKESNSGGNAGQHLARMGIRALIIEGGPADAGTCHGLIVDSTGIRLVAADEFAGSWNYDTCRRLGERFPAKASFIVCGPAGEQELAAASIACTDRDNRYPTRHAARGGLGAVMGSKRLKYIVIDPGKEYSAARVAKRKTEFKECLRQQSKRYLDGPQRMAKGTARAVAKAASLNTLPYKNRRAGSPPAEDVKGLDGATILASFATRGGGMHNCMSGCIVNCSNLVNREDGSYLTSALELETLGLLGSNCAVGKWDEVGELDRLCDDIGLDTMEIGVAVGVLMDAGRMPWGDVAAMTDLLHQVAAGTELGRVVGNGARSVGEFTGHPRVPVVKGQGLPVWDPRVMKATGVTYATSAMGADHTAGIVTLVGLPHDNLAALSQEAQILNAIGDSAGYCQFIGATIDELHPLLEALFDRAIDSQVLIDMGWQCLQAEWEFNRRAGFTAGDDDLPQCMKTEPIGEWAYVFDVDRATLQQVKQSLMPLSGDFCQKPFF